MGRLDDVDLSLKLSRKEEDQLLALHGTRLAQLRLALGGLIGDRAARAAAVRPLRGLGRQRQGRRDQAPRRPARRRATCASSRSPRRRPTRSATTSCTASSPALPGWGGMAVLDRTWYGRVLVERVEGFATEEQWQRAYDEIDDFERMLADEGMIIVKLCLHISDDEQLKRFERRREDPLKAWKLTDEDWRNREKRPAYEAAVEDMLERTDTERAPWHLVAAESKRYARVRVMEEVIAAIEDGCARSDFPLPAPLEAVTD